MCKTVNNEFYGISSREPETASIGEKIHIKDPESLIHKYNEILALLQKHQSPNDDVIEEKVKIVSKEFPSIGVKLVAKKLSLLAKSTLRKIICWSILMANQFPAVKKTIVKTVSRHPSVNYFLRKVSGRNNKLDLPLTFVEPEVAKEPDSVKRIYLSLPRVRK